MVVLAALGFAACHRVEAKLPPPAAPPPPLIVPAPPDRFVVPVTLQTEEVVEPPAPAATTPSSSPNRSNRNPEKPAAPPPAAPPPVADPPPPVQTTTNVGLLEAHAKQELQRATTDIDKVQYATLSPSGRAQYDEVLRYIREAERHMTMKNYLFADELAKKAALLASLLVKGGVD
jgi:hypothetical protein